MARSRDSHGGRGSTANEFGIQEERAEILRKVTNSLLKRNPGLVKRWLADEGGTDEEFNQAFEAEMMRMEEAGEL